MFLKLFLTFLEIGAVSFGGGYGMISLIREKVLLNGWLSEAEFLSFIAVSESTPGPLAVNMATFIGASQGGVLGALCATLGVVLPSFLIIYAISLFFEQFTQLTVIANAFKGIQVCVIYLIFSAGVRMLQALDRSLFSSGVLLSVFLAMTSLSLAGISVSSILLILLSGAAGVAAWLLGRRKEGK